MLDDMAVQ
jgi:hypothetical protein